MSILKNRLAKKYSQLPNELITDTRLSHGALRVCAYLFTKPDDWEVYNKDIMNKLGICTAQTIANYWKELEETGWITRERQQDDQGKFSGGYNYILNTDNPYYGKTVNRGNATNGKTNKHTNTELKTNTDLSTKNKLNAREENKEFSKPKNSESKEKSCDKKEKRPRMLDRVDADNITDEQHDFIKKEFTRIWKNRYPKWIGRGVYEKDNFIRIACDITRYLYHSKDRVLLKDVYETFKKLINNPPEYMTQQTPKSVYNNLNLYFQNLETKPNGKRKFSIKEAYEALERNE